MTRPLRNLSASVEKRLLNRAQQLGEDFQYVLMRYGLERLMYRLSQSSYARRFIVKGAMLLPVWTGERYRPTKDLDLLAIGEESNEELKLIFRDLCASRVEDDGLVFLEETIRVREIREDNIYGGRRVTLLARLGKIRISLQIDIGFGDTVIPKATEKEFPTLLKFPAATLPVYSRESAIAEKYETIVNLGISNSRMKDYYDIWLLSRQFEFDGEILKKAIEATFRRRRTMLPRSVTPGLSNDFVSDPGKQSQWLAFMRRSRLDLKDISFGSVVEAIADFILPPSRAAAKGEQLTLTWSKGGPWKKR
jgi:predicted nucleotidyltransferase component of viral defense system